MLLLNALSTRFPVTAYHSCLHAPAPTEQHSFATHRCLQDAFTPVMMMVDVEDQALPEQLLMHIDAYRAGGVKSNMTCRPCKAIKMNVHGLNCRTDHICRVVHPSISLEHQD